MDLVENYPKMSHLLKKLAFAEVYIWVSHNQVTLHSYKYFANKSEPSDFHKLSRQIIVPVCLLGTSGYYWVEHLLHYFASL